jgi:hypothetical protein
MQSYEIERETILSGTGVVPRKLEIDAVSFDWFCKIPDHLLLSGLMQSDKAD